MHVIKEVEVQTKGERFEEKLIGCLHDCGIRAFVSDKGYVQCESDEFVRPEWRHMPYVTLQVDGGELILKVSTGVGVTARIAYSYALDFLKRWNAEHPGMAAHLSQDAIPLCRFVFEIPTTLRGLAGFVAGTLRSEILRGCEFCAKFSEGAWKYLD